MLPACNDSMPSVSQAALGCQLMASSNSLHEGAQPSLGCLSPQVPCRLRKMRLRLACLDAFDHRGGLRL